MIKRWYRAMTLAEMLVVLLIVGLLAAVALPTFFHFQSRHLEKQACETVRRALDVTREKAKLRHEDWAVFFVPAAAHEAPYMQRHSHLLGRAMIFAVRDGGRFVQRDEAVLLPLHVYWDELASGLALSMYEEVSVSENGLIQRVSLPVVWFKAKSGEMVLGSAGHVLRGQIGFENAVDALIIDASEQRVMWHVEN